MTTGTKEIYVEDPESGEEFIVSAEWCVSGRYTPAKLYGPPENCYPAEYPEFEWTEFTLDEFGRTYILSTADLEEVGVDLDDVQIEVAEEEDDNEPPEPEYNSDDKFDRDQYLADREQDNWDGGY